MLPKKLMSLHDIPKRKEKRTIALCDKKQPGYVRCGWDTDAHTATTAAAPSTSTPPSSGVTVTAQRQLLLLVCERFCNSDSDNAAAKHAPASVLLDSLLHRLFRLVSPAPSGESSASPRPSNGHVRGIGLFLYNWWLQLRKFWRRFAKRRKRRALSSSASASGSSTHNESGATSSNDASGSNSDNICGNSCEHVSQLLRRRRPYDRLQQQWLPGTAEQPAVRQPTLLPEPPSAHIAHLPTTSPWPGQRCRRCRDDNDSHAPSHTQPELECVAEAVKEQADQRATAGREEPRRSAFRQKQCRQQRYLQFTELSAVHPDQVHIRRRRGATRDHVPDVFLVRPQGRGRAEASAHLPQCQGLRLCLLQSAALVPHNTTHRFR